MKKLNKFKVTAVALIVSMLTPNLALAASTVYDGLSKEQISALKAQSDAQDKAGVAQVKNELVASINKGSQASIFQKSNQAGQQNAENCDDINASVAETFAKTAKMILPDNPDDNVYTAVANSGAEATNEGSFLDDIFNFDLSSISLLGGSIWSAITALAEKAIDAAKKAAMRALKKAAESAVKAGIRAINTAYAKQLSKLSDKLGFAGPIVTTALGGIVPSITQTAGSCAMTMDANCASKIADAIGQSAKYGFESAVNKSSTIAENAARAAINEQVNNAANKAMNAIDKNTPNVISNAAREVVSNAEYNLRLTSERIGNDVSRAVNKAGQAAQDTWNNQPKHQSSNSESGGNTNFFYNGN